MTKPAKGDAFRSHWLAMPLMSLLADRSPAKPPAHIELRVGDQPQVLETAEGRVLVRPGSAEHPDVVLTGSPELVIGLLAGRLDVATARSRGLRVEGDSRVLRRIKPLI
jgi:hypothetical protein